MQYVSRFEYVSNLFLGTANNRGTNNTFILCFKHRDGKCCGVLLGVHRRQSEYRDFLSIFAQLIWVKGQQPMLITISFQAINRMFGLQILTKHQNNRLLYSPTLKVKYTLYFSYFCLLFEFSFLCFDKGMLAVSHFYVLNALSYESHVRWLLQKHRSTILLLRLYY